MKPSPKPTSFQMKVYKATSHIPRGKVATYGWVARQIGCRSAQAVGGALRVNPFAPKVPCHRVVAANGSLHGFAGHTSGPLIAKKRRLLQEEGITFDALGRVIKDQILRWEIGLTKILTKPFHSPSRHTDRFAPPRPPSNFS